MSTEEATRYIRGQRSDVSRLAELLLRWEEEYERGKDISPDELCADCPALVPRLAERIAVLKDQSWLRHSGRDRSVEGSWRTGPGVAQPEGQKVLAGKYRLDRVIGDGGSGQVWQGFDEDLGRPVAVKIPRPAATPAVDQAERFIAEAKRVAQLRHPGIIAVHDVRADEDGCFIVSDLVNGTDLRRHLLSGPLPVPAALRIVAETAEALHYAHEQGFIHRDVKPGNILVDGSGHVLVTDFGIAATAEEIRQQHGSWCGTPGYMSPEQQAGAGGRIDRRTDIYSLGIVLYEVLTGERPFQSNSPAVLRDQILRENPQPLRLLNPEVPKEVERICLKCLAKGPEGRYATAQEVAGELRRLLRRRGRERWRRVMVLVLAGLTVTLACCSALAPMTPDGAPPKYLAFETDGMANSRATARDIELEKGLERLWEKDYRGAIEHFDAALAFRKTVTVLSVKADAHLQLGEYDEVIKCCDEVLRVEPQFPKAHFTKGLAYKAMNQPDKALECFRLAAKNGERKAEEEIGR